MSLAEAVRALVTPVQVRRSRSAWAAVARQYGLAFHRGPHLRYIQGDRLEGTLERSRVTVSAIADYDLQKVVVVVSAESEGVPPGLALQREELVAWYCEHRTAAPSAPALDPDFESWVLGRREGLGVSAAGGRLIYRQLFGIEDPATLGCLIERLATWSRQIALVAPARPGA